MVGGVDGVKGGGWILAVTGVCPESPVEGFFVWGSFADLWSDACQKGLLAVAVDIPIGLPCGGDRAADREARQRLKGKPGRQSSVFPAVPWCALRAKTYEEAQELARRCTGKGLSRQAYALLPRIREVRGVLQPDDHKSEARPLAAEVHPEVSFAALADGSPMRFHKSRQPGVAERLDLLKREFPNIVNKAVVKEIEGTPVPALDDALDAAVAAWSARRIVREEAIGLGDGEIDPSGYPMSIRV